MSGYWIPPEMMQRLAGSLLHFVWQGALVALFTALVLRFLARRSADARYAVSVSVFGLLLMAIAPLATFVFYAQTGALTLRLLRLAGEVVATASSQQAAQSANTLAWTQWIVAAWFTGVAVCSFRLVAGWRLSKKLRQTSDPLVPQRVVEIFEGIRERLIATKPIQLLISTRIDTPAVIGWMRPAILLPVTSITGLTEEQLMAVFAHELAHIRRNDFLVNVLQRSIEAVLFYHPAVWWLSARIRAERENCCDDLAVQVCGDRLLYAEALIELERSRDTAVPALAVAATGGSLVHRVRRILGRETASQDWQSAAIALLFVVVWIVGGVWQSESIQAAPVRSASLAPAALAFLPPQSTVLQSIAAIATAQPVVVPEPEPAGVQQQNAPPAELGTIQGVVTRTGSTEPISNAEIVLEGGVVDPEALQSILRTASNVGVAITPPPGASLSEINQMLVKGAVERGVPLSATVIQNFVNQALGGRKWPTTVTDRDGRFTFKDVVPARYTVRAVRDGYFGKATGGVYTPGASIDVTVSGKYPQEASISMVQGAIIGGRIFDASGELPSNVTVQAFSVGYTNGYAQLQSLVSKTTDDRGEYRLLWLPPGDYYVGVAPRAGALAGPSATVMTFYPRVASLSDAIPVVIHGGEDLRGIDIGMRPSRGFKISGKVTSSVPLPTSVAVPEGAALPSAVLMLVNRGLDVPDNLGVRTLGSVPLVSGIASFDVSGIPAGSYELFARLSDPTGTGAAGFAWGHVPIDVRDADVSNIAITVASVVEVKGTVRAVGGPTLPPGVRIVLLAADSASKIPYYRLVSTRGTPVDVDGSFAVSAIAPGRYRVGAVSGLPPDLYVADVRQNARSVFDSGFDVDSRAPAPIEIVIGGGAGVVAGTVQDGPFKPVPGATVGLVPEARRLENRALYATATTDSSGRFTFSGVAPGDYRLFALENAPPNAYQNLGFIQKNESRGRFVHVTQGSTVSAELTVTP